MDSFIRSLDARLHGESPFSSVLEKLESMSGMSRANIVISCVLTIIGLGIVFGHTGRFLCFVVGLLYPAYYTFHALEYNTEDRTRWLTYWVVYASFSMATFFPDLALSGIWMYWSLKLLFLVWCVIPFSYNGSDYVYGNFIRPFVLENVDVLENVAHTIEESYASIMTNAFHTTEQPR